MVTKELYLEDSYLDKTFARIISIDKVNLSIELDRSIIYPGGGGQPLDCAVVSKYPVVYANRSNNRLFYHLKVPNLNSIKVNQKVVIKIDWPFRYSVMRLHTAQHIFAAVTLSKYDTKIAGNDISPSRSHIDFEIEKNFTKDEYQDIEDKVNEIISQNQPVKTIMMTLEETKEKLSPKRTRFNRLPSASEFRVIKIGNFDLTPCGGTHVKQTGEIGKFTIKKFKSRGKKRKRFYYEVFE